MSKIMVGVFVTVFVSALIYEVVKRNSPELADRIVRKLKGTSAT